jgi:hypothetical protein
VLSLAPASFVKLYRSANALLIVSFGLLVAGSRKCAWLTFQLEWSATTGDNCQSAGTASGGCPSQIRRMDFEISAAPSVKKFRR